MSIRLTRLAAPSALAFAAMLGACSNSETGPDVHTPTSVKLIVDGVDRTADLTLPAGAASLVVVKFYDQHGDEMTTIETEHYSTLTFTPADLAALAVVAGHHFQHNVTAQAAAGAGTVMVGFGHDAMADEYSFGPFTVTVMVP
jgi:hypothetical protein